MKVGDLIQHCFVGELVGVIVREVYDVRVAKTENKVFDILWQDGTMGCSIWDYDLEVVSSESR